MKSLLGFGLLIGKKMQLEDVTLGFFRLILKIVSRLIALSSSIEAQQSSLIETNQTLYRSKSSKCRICIKLWSLVDTGHLNMPDFHTQIHALLTKMPNNNRNCPVKSLEFLILTLYCYSTTQPGQTQSCNPAVYVVALEKEVHRWVDPLFFFTSLRYFFPNTKHSKASKLNISWP